MEFKREASLSDLSRQSEAELQAIRNAMVEHDGLVVSLFDVLRRVPRRVLMVLKLNDLARYVAFLGLGLHYPDNSFQKSRQCPCDNPSQRMS